MYRLILARLSYIKLNEFTMKTMDIIRPAKPTEASTPIATPASLPPRLAQLQARKRPYVMALPKKSTRRIRLNPKLKKVLKTLLFFVAGTVLLVGLAVLGAIGQLLLALLVVPVVWRKVDSRLGFGLAVLALIYAALLQAARLASLAQSMATLAYICLVISAIELGFETRRKKKFGFKKRLR